MKGPDGLNDLLERAGDEAAEVAWEAALAWIERAAREARMGHYPSRFRWYPQGELRRLRRDLTRALQLARFAVALQESENELLHELTEGARIAASEAAAARRREQTLPAEQARLANAAKRRAAKQSDGGKP